MRYLLSILLTLCLSAQAWAATYYIVGMSGKTWTSSSTNMLSTSSGGASGAGPSTVSDSIILDQNSGHGAFTIASTAACADFTANFSNNTDQVLSLSGDWTIGSGGAGNLTINGYSRASQAIIQSNSVGVQRNIHANSFTASNLDFQDIALTHAVDFSAQNDIGGGTTLTGCSGITFPAGRDIYWVHGSSADYSVTDARWYTSANGSTADRMPLLQDVAKFDTGFSSGTGKRVFVNVPRCAGMDWTNANNNPAVWKNYASTTWIYGSIKLISNMSFLNPGYALFGRSNFELNPAGKDNIAASLYCPGGKYTLIGDATWSGTFYIQYGDFDANDHNVTFTGSGNMGISGGSGVHIWMGNGTWTVPTSWSPKSDWVMYGEGSTITFSSTSTTAKTFAGSTNTYNNIVIPYPATTNTLTFSGNFTANSISMSGTPNSGQTVKFTSGSTTTLTGNQPWLQGSAGNLITIQATTGGSPATLKNDNYTVTTDYVAMTDITASSATGKTPFHSGIHSTTSNCLNWDLLSGFSSNVLFFGGGL